MAGPASIYSLAAEDHARAESVAWARFSAARNDSEFYASWLAILCAQIDRVGGALLLLGPDQSGAYAPAAVWPDASRDLQYLSSTAEKTLKERRGIIAAPDGSSPPARDQDAYVGYPIEVSGVLHGAVVLDIAPAPEAALQRALRLVHWASAWMLNPFLQRTLEHQAGQLRGTALALDLVATAFQERRFAASALAVVNELAARLQCERVTLGVAVSGGIRVKAISHTATFDSKTSLVRLIGEAMEEVLDADSVLVYPRSEDDQYGPIVHAELAREFGDVAICSVPLREDGQLSGVLTLERNAREGFTADTVALCETVGELLGPILGLKRANERGSWQRIGQALAGGAECLLGPNYPGVKLIALIIVGAAAFLSLRAPIVFRPERSSKASCNAPWSLRMTAISWRASFALATPSCRVKS
jgi:hypothetical protein